VGIGLGVLALPPSLRWGVTTLLVLRQHVVTRAVASFTTVLVRLMILITSAAIDSGIKDLLCSMQDGLIGDVVVII
jgi:hypothetical protein